MVKLICLDFDGTLTDGLTWYGGEALGWLQRYSVRDGEAILRLLRRGVAVVPLSRNATLSARRRAELIGLPLEWLGVTDKSEALRAIIARHALTPAEVCMMGDGREDAALFAQVGFRIAVADAHPDTCAAAQIVLESPGGRHAVEMLELYLERLGKVPNWRG